MAAKVILTIQGGCLDGREYAFDKPGRCVIGRSEDCAVQLPNRGWEFWMVSRHHCRLDIDPPHIRVTDLGSRNGTYINGRLIGVRASGESPEAAADLDFHANELHDRDMLRVGPVHFRVSVMGVKTAEAEAAEA